MTFDPYAVLGLDRSATDADVKRAFRSRAKQHHPDKSGDRKKFEDTVRANLILSDPARRSRYDRDGVIDDDAQVDPLQAAKEFVVSLLLQLADQQGDNIFRHDVIKAVENACGQQLAQLHQQRKAFEDKIAKRKKFADRFRHKDENDFVRRALRHEAGVIERNLSEIDKQVGIRKEALALLKEYEFERDKEPTIQTMYLRPPWEISGTAST